MERLNYYDKIFFKSAKTKWVYNIIKNSTTAEKKLTNPFLFVSTGNFVSFWFLTSLAKTGDGSDYIKQFQTYNNTSSSMFIIINKYCNNQ